MAVTPLHSHPVTSTPTVAILEDISADLNRARVFSSAAGLALDEIRKWAIIYKLPEHLIQQLDDLGTLMSEAGDKAEAAKASADKFITQSS